MHLQSPRRETSFYETFSDLIFCTLVIFIVIIMALVLRVRDEVDTIVAPNRFTGGSASTFYIAIVPHEGGTGLLWVPQEIAIKEGMNRSDGRTDPVLMLCRLALGADDGLLVTPAPDFIEMGGHVSNAFARTVVMSARIGALHTGIEAARKHYGARFQSLTPEQLKRDLGGLYAVYTDQRDGVEPVGYARAAYAEYTRFASSLDSNNLYSLQPRTSKPFIERSAKHGGADPWIRFRAGPGRTIRVGETTLTPGEFRNVLRSIVVGKGFFIEFISETGEETSPPDWVVSEILSPVGFDQRVVKKEVLDAIGE